MVFSWFLLSSFFPDIPSERESLMRAPLCQPSIATPIFAKQHFNMPLSRYFLMLWVGQVEAQQLPLSRTQRRTSTFEQLHELAILAIGPIEIAAQQTHARTQQTLVVEPNKVPYLNAKDSHFLDSRNFSTASVCAGRGRDAEARDSGAGRQVSAHHLR